MWSYRYFFRIFTFPKIKREQYVGNVFCLSFAFTWLKAVTFFYVENKKDWLVVIINGIAVLVESYYFVRHFLYSTGWRRILALVMGVVRICFLAGMLTMQFNVFNHGKHSDVRDRVYGITQDMRFLDT